MQDLATPANIRLGKAIAKDGGVEFLEREKGRAKAKVGGGQRRTTTVTTSMTGMHCRCTCSKKQKKFCKHCVAVVMAMHA